MFEIDQLNTKLLEAQDEIVRQKKENIKGLEYEELYNKLNQAHYELLEDNELKVYEIENLQKQAEEYQRIISQNFNNRDKDDENAKNQ